MIRHHDLSSHYLLHLIRTGKVRFGGHRPGKIYGTLRCASGKKMKKENRVFFESEAAAIHAGYRPCGRCLPEQYQRWRSERDRLRQQ